MHEDASRECCFKGMLLQGNVASRECCACRCFKMLEHAIKMHEHASTGMHVHDEASPCMPAEASAPPHVCACARLYTTGVDAQDDD